AVEEPECAHHRRLHDVLGVVIVAQQPAGQVVACRQVRQHQLLERHDAVRQRPSQCPGPTHATGAPATLFPPAPQRRSRTSLFLNRPLERSWSIAAVHDEAASAEETDWAQILGLYGLLQRMSDNPMVTLNHAVALAMVHGPAAGLERLDALAKDPRLQGHHRLDAVR